MITKTDLYFYFDRQYYEGNIDDDWADLVIEDIDSEKAFKAIELIADGKIGEWLLLERHLICLKKLKYAKVYEYEVELDEE